MECAENIASYWVTRRLLRGGLVDCSLLWSRSSLYRYLVRWPTHTYWHWLAVSAGSEVLQGKYLPQTLTTASNTVIICPRATATASDAQSALASCRCQPPFSTPCLMTTPLISLRHMVLTQGGPALTTEPLKGRTY